MRLESRIVQIKEDNSVGKMMLKLFEFYQGVFIKCFDVAGRDFKLGIHLVFLIDSLSMQKLDELHMELGDLESKIINAKILQVVYFDKELNRLHNELEKLVA